jgi:hypothetical protein
VQQIVHRVFSRTGPQWFSYVKLTIDCGTGTTWRYRPVYEDIIKVGEAASERLEMKTVLMMTF